MRWFTNDLHEWWSHKWKSLANHITSDHKIVIQGNDCNILFLTCYFMSWTHNSTKNNHWLLISPLSPRKIFSDLVLWHQHSWSVMSREREVLALWRYIRQLFLHVQIGIKVISTSVAVNYGYRWYKSIWKFRLIIDMDFSISLYRVSNLTSAIMG